MGLKDQSVHTASAVLLWHLKVQSMWPPSWKEIVEHAEKDLDYMFNNDTIRKGEEMGHMDHFRLHYANRLMLSFYEDFEEEIYEIERAIIPWIREEEQHGYLRDRTLWRPFRDPDYEVRSMMGYKRIFIYEPKYRANQFFTCYTDEPRNWSRSKNGAYRINCQMGPQEYPCSDGHYPRLTRVFFMLTIMHTCDTPGCLNCPTTRSPWCPHYVASLYGWEEDDTPNWKPYCHMNPNSREYAMIQCGEPCVVPDQLWQSPPVFDPFEGLVLSSESDWDDMEDTWDSNDSE